MQVDFQRLADAIAEAPKRIDRAAAQTLFPRAYDDAKSTRKVAA
jgi:hypothetical protein